jgi:hypothetical protein
VRSPAFPRVLVQEVDVPPVVLEGAVQVEFERHVLKPGFHLIGSRVETRRLSAMGSNGSGGVNVHRPTSKEP